MPLCRLCVIDKNSDELVISLKEQVKKLELNITFAEYVEYYCQLSLNPNPELSQVICQSCKSFVENFADFSYKIEQNQKYLVENLRAAKQLNKRNIQQQNSNSTIVNTVVNGSQVEIKQEINDSSDYLEKHTKETETKQKRAVTPKRNEEPVAKKQKIDVYDINAADEFPVENVSFAAKARKGSTRKMRPRTKSIYIEPQDVGDSRLKKTSDYLKEIEKLFDDQSSDVEQYVHIEIPPNKLRASGEVPEKWLKLYEDFKTWKDMKFNCSGHCDKKFDDLFSLLMHNYETTRDADHFIKCPFCDRKPFRNRDAISSFINHMTRDHKFGHLKFCCIVCSKVFYNIPRLTKHYLDCHSTIRVRLFPCLDCGTYCQQHSKLVKHKQVHDKKASIR